MWLAQNGLAAANQRPGWTAFTPQPSGVDRTHTEKWELVCRFQVWIIPKQGFSTPCSAVFGRSAQVVFFDTLNAQCLERFRYPIHEEYVQWLC